MFALSSGRAGNFEELGLAADEQQVASIAASGRIPVEVVLPDGSSSERPFPFHFRVYSLHIRNGACDTDAEEGRELNVAGMHYRLCLCYLLHACCFHHAAAC